MLPLCWGTLRQPWPSSMASPSCRVTGRVRRARPDLSSHLSLCVPVPPALGGRAGFALPSPGSRVPTSSRKPRFWFLPQGLPWASNHLCIHLSGVNAFQPHQTHTCIPGVSMQPALTSFAGASERISEYQAALSTWETTSSLHPFAE